MVQCTLLSGAFGNAVQMVLAAAAFSGLVYKRSFEQPKRSFHIWIFDSAKQGIAALYIHICNIVFSVFLSLQNAFYGGSTNECATYFWSVTLDVTVGTAMVFVLIKAQESLAVSAEAVLLR